jgi:nucleoside-diphosphate-sugar epimerase
VVALLREPGVDVIAAVRSHHQPSAVADLVQREFDLTTHPDDDWLARLSQVVLPDDPTDLEAEFDEIVNCAGSVSYFDSAELEAVNVELTRDLLSLAADRGAAKFVHLSTAFASGYANGTIDETLHQEPKEDPTPYTSTKRKAEHLVAASGVPYLILRPSIVIGDSRDGHYSGPRYGLYQLWSGLERFLMNEYHPDVHFVAPRVPATLLHQDAFQAAFVAAWRQLPDDSILHLVSRREPTVREVADLFFLEKLRPRTIHYHDRLDDLNRSELGKHQRAFLRIAATNVEISSRMWNFAATGLGSLDLSAHPFIDASVETVRLCQDTYLASSNRYATYCDRFDDQFPATTAIAERPT